MTARTRRDSTPFAVAAILFLAYAWFFQAGGWNQNSRFALVRAIVEQATLRIDDTARFEGRLITGDLARHGGHIYSDKAPGLALAAVPIVFVARPFVARAPDPSRIATLAYIATIFTAGLPTIVTALLVLWLAMRSGASRTGATFAALVYGLGTPAWCYATLFTGHALSTACLFLAFAGAIELREQQSTTRTMSLALTVGGAGGWATITEYPTVVPTIAIAALALVHANRRDTREARRVAIGIGLGASVCCLVLAWFDTVAFGSPFRIGYQSTVGFVGMHRGLFGLTYPNPRVLVALLFGQFRGLLFLAPILAVAPWGLAALADDPRWRSTAFTAGAIAVYGLLFNASYVYWDGGWSYGPRHMAPSLPFLCLGLATLFSRTNRASRAVLVVAAAYGFLLTFVAVSTTAQPPDTYAHPVTDLLWPSFARGRLSINWQSFLEARPRGVRDPVAHAWNLGERVRLAGLSSIVPLVVAWGAIGVGVWVGRRRQRDSPHPRS